MANLNGMLIVLLGATAFVLAATGVVTRRHQSALVPVDRRSSSVAQAGR